MIILCVRSEYFGQTAGVGIRTARKIDTALTAETEETQSRAYVTENCCGGEAAAGTKKKKKNEITNKCGGRRGEKKVDKTRFI